jgi:hypothetical protein
MGHNKSSHGLAAHSAGRRVPFSSTRRTRGLLAFVHRTGSNARRRSRRPSERVMDLRATAEPMDYMTVAPCTRSQPRAPAPRVSSTWCAPSSPPLPSFASCFSRRARGLCTRTWRKQVPRRMWRGGGGEIGFDRVLDGRRLRDLSSESLGPRR